MDEVVYFFGYIENNNDTNNEYNRKNKGADKFFKNVSVNCFKKHRDKCSRLIPNYLTDRRALPTLN